MTEAVKLKKAPAYRFFVWVILVVSWIQIYMGMQLPAAYATNIMASLGVKDTTLSLIATGTTLSLAIMCLISGSVVVKIGAKPTCILGCGIQAISGLLFLTNPTNLGLIICLRLLEGIGGGLITAVTQGLISVWFPKKERGLSAGIMYGTYGLGLAASTYFVNLFNNMNLTWSQGIGAFLAGAGIICGLVILCFYRDINKTYGVAIIDEAIEGNVDDDNEIAEAAPLMQNGKHLPSNYSEMLRSGAFWLVMGAVFAYSSINMGLGYIFPLLFPDFGYTAAQTATITSVGFISTMICSPIGGVISDRVFHTKRGPVVIISYAIAFVAIIALIMGLNAHASVGMLSVLAFCAYFGVPFSASPIFALPAEILDPKFFPVGLGFMLFVTDIGGVIVPMVASALKASSGSYIGGLVFCVILATFSGICSIIFTKKYKA